MVERLKLNMDIAYSPAITEPYAILPIVKQQHSVDISIIVMPVKHITINIIPVRTDIVPNVSIAKDKSGWKNNRMRSCLCRISW
jgi:hypothetical protein